MKSFLTIKGPVVLKVNLANNIFKLVLTPSVLFKQVVLLLSHRGILVSLARNMSIQCCLEYNKGCGKIMRF